MANVTIHGLTALASVATDDELAVYDASAATTKRATVTSVLQSRLTGTGTVALSSFTLTVPATMTAAGRDVANTFTVQQNFAPTSTTTPAIQADAPAGTTQPAILIRYNSSNAMLLYALATDRSIRLGAWDNGSSFGSYLQLGRNSNASTPAAGFLIMDNNAGSPYRLWVDGSGNLRIVNSTNPTSGNDTVGTVVGAQTSMAEAKHLSADLSPVDAVIARVRAGAGAVRRFVYRSGSFNGETFEGVVTDLAPAYGVDRDETHPQGKSLNEIQIIGDLLRAVDYLAGRVAELEASR